MSVAVSIISTIIKSAIKSKVGNELSNELIGISVDDVSEKGISKINDFINNGRTKIEKILSKEKMKSMDISEDNIACVIAEVKGLFSEIEITDDIFRQCKFDSLNLCSFLWKKYSENKTDYIEHESDIKKSLLAISEELIKLLRESEEFVKDISIQISNTVEDSRVEIQRISDYLEENFSKISADNQKIFNILRKILEQNQKSKMQKKSRTQEYADKWNANMFLNNFDKRDENAGVNVKLSDVYIDDHLPHYIWWKNNQKKPLTDLKELLSEYINEKRDNKMLMIFGQPGIGKSTLITWITANFNDRINDILVYKFASDLGNMDWKNDRISNKILDELGLKRNDLNGKILILDGFDEVSIENHRRNDILDDLYGDWIYNKTIENFSLIITCRENYIKKFAILKCKYITLQPWDEKQIRSFCNIFQEKTKSSISDGTLKKMLENKSILGIPLIIYMVLALDISIEEEGSIVDVYDKIFSLEGGIYDRCIDNKSFADKHRIAEIKKQIHQISREIAIWMFENNPDRAIISKKEYENICASVTKEIEQKDIGQDFVIGNFFELKHCEGEKGEELYFVHRSIYEYFVVETIYSSIEDSIKILSDESQKELASNIAIYLKQGRITNTIGEYFQYKINRLLNQICLEKKNQFYDWWESAVARMIEDGMFYYTNKSITCYKNIISKECNCFENILKITRLFINIGNKKYLMKNIDRRMLEKYIKCCLIEKRRYKRAYHDSSRSLHYHTYYTKVSKGAVFSQEEIERLLFDMNEIVTADICLNKMDLSEIDFEDINLSEIDLYEANLERANLCEANLERANLERANLSQARLKNINLRGTNLRGTNLSKASLEGANLQEVVLSKETTLSNADFSNADLRNVILNGAILNKTILERAKLNNAILLFADLRESNLKKAIFNYTDLRLADLRGADLHEANFNGANLMFTKFDEEQITYLTNCDLSKSLVYVEKYDRFVDYLKYQKMKNDDNN